jgi:hypothetical protein
MTPDSGLPTNSSRLNFNEQEWIKLLYLLADTQAWLDDLTEKAILQIPIEDKKKLLRKTYLLTPLALTHILEKHYYRIPRYPYASKFAIPLPDILHFIRMGADVQPIACTCSRNLKRSFDTGTTIGFNKEGQPVTVITIITDAAGKIISAYPDSSFGSVSPNRKLETCNSEQPTDP